MEVMDKEQSANARGGATEGLEAGLADGLGCCRGARTGSPMGCGGTPRSSSSSKESHASTSPARCAGEEPAPSPPVPPLARVVLRPATTGRVAQGGRA
mmetsp:Transcript_14595/g.43171  ORF Transcript_14595/g.43171 Transcript_14595/m.43171 type:complete len:98 (+) Transcript_14595:668-961(+)